MRWEKRGLFVPAPPPVQWASSHAMVPVADELPDGRLRLYFTARDADGRSHVGSADMVFPSGEPAYRAEPVLAPGPLGAFDDSGVMSGSLVRHEGRQFLYYIGWSKGVTVPFYTFIGCAVSDDGGATFTRVSPSPILERGPQDPYLTTSPWVLVDEGRWRMWYVSGTGWRLVDGAPRHWYHIRYAESEDGVHWARDGRVCIDYADEREYAISRPCVVRDGDLYRMWYSRRGDSYRIGYAESPDGLSWTRKDMEVGIGVSAEGWDSEMIEYPLVLDVKGVRYLLYNGNGYGATGIGYAALRGE